MPARHAHQMALHPRHPRHRAEAEPQITPFEIARIKATVLTPTERTEHQDPAAIAFAEFKAGRGDRHKWGEIVDALNVAEALAQRHRIAQDHLATILAGQNALAAVYARQLTSWTLRGTEIAALTEALFIWRVQLQFCSYGELTAAKSYVERRALQVQRSANVAGVRLVGVDA